MVNITVKYYVPVITGNQNVRPPSTGSGGQVMPIGQMPQPETRDEEKVLLTRQIRIPESGIISLSVTFPRAAKNGNIRVI